MIRRIPTTPLQHTLAALTAGAIVLTTAAPASTWYVAVDGNDDADGTGWPTAFATISNGVAQASAGDTVLVSNGTYHITARIVISKAITLQSLNGQHDTFIDPGYVDGIGCMRIEHADAVVEGFTLTNAYVNSVNYGSSAGIFMTDGTVRWCTIDNVRGYGDGGALRMQGGLVENCIIRNCDYGHYHGTIRMDNGANAILRNCLVADNYYRRGGGIYAWAGNRIENCTIVANQGGEHTGGIYGGATVINTIVYYNTDTDDTGENYGGSPAFTYSCSLPLPAGTGNIDGAPQFVSVAQHDYRLLAGSPCTNAGTTNMAWLVAPGAVDLDGNARLRNGKVDMGCYQYHPPVIGCNFTGDDLEGIAPHSVTFTSVLSGTNTTGATYYWDFDNDGTTDSNAANPTHAYAPGTYTVTLTVSNAAGDSASYTRPDYIQAGPATNFVSTTGSHTFPYDSWATAANDVQSAVNAAVDGTLVRVTNGTYIAPATINVLKGVSIRSENGSDVTIVRRNSDRAFYISHPDAIIDGLGITRQTTSNGGGVQIHLYGTVQNCDIFKGRHEHGYGANVRMSGGTVRNCTIRDASDRHIGGVYMSGGGALVENCMITDNGNHSYTGTDKVNGVRVNSGCTLRNCVVARNYGVGRTGGVLVDSGGLVENCTIVSNTLSNVEADACGGVRNSGTIRNSIIVHNSNPSGGAYTNWYGGGTIEYSCTTPSADALGGTGNITADPRIKDLAGGNYRLMGSSPCRNAGLYQAWMDTATDLDGNPRLMAPPVDMGAYELWPFGSIFFVQ